MIAHVALFHWKDGTTEEQIAQARAALHALPAQIDALRSYTAEANLRVRPSTADFGVVAVVDDEAAVAAYLDHPAHKAAVESFLAPIIAERTVAQLPFEPGPLA